MCISRLVTLLERVLQHPRPNAFAHEPRGLVLTGWQVALLQVSPVPPRECFLVHVVTPLAYAVEGDAKGVFQRVAAYCAIPGMVMPSDPLCEMLHLVGLLSDPNQTTLENS